MRILKKLNWHKRSKVNNQEGIKPLYDLTFGDSGTIRVRIYYDEGRPELKYNYVEIRGMNDLFVVRLDMRMRAYEYLLAMAVNNQTDAIHDFALVLYLVLSAMTTNKAFTDDLRRAVDKYFKSLDKQAQKAAKSVTDEQEMGAQVFMQEAIERGEAIAKGGRTARKAQEKSRKEMREVLNEDKINK